MQELFKSLQTIKVHGLSPTMIVDDGTTIDGTIIDTVDATIDAVPTTGIIKLNLHGCMIWIDLENFKNLYNM